MNSKAIINCSNGSLSNLVLSLLLFFSGMFIIMTGVFLLPLLPENAQIIYAFGIASYSIWNTYLIIERWVY